MNTGENHPKDRPVEECLETAQKLWAAGGVTFQKFTCSTCGQRLTMDEPNVFFAEGTCDQCGAVTDIVKQGCGYTLMFTL